MYEVGAEMGDVYGPSWYTIGITVMAAYTREQTNEAEKMTYETVWRMVKRGVTGAC
jgi:hypothetical protein